MTQERVNSFVYLYGVKQIWVPNGAQVCLLCIWVSLKTLGKQLIKHLHFRHQLPIRVWMLPPGRASTPVGSTFSGWCFREVESSERSSRLSRGHWVCVVLVDPPPHRFSEKAT